MARKNKKLPFVILTAKYNEFTGVVTQEMGEAKDCKAIGYATREEAEDAREELVNELLTAGSDFYKLGGECVSDADGNIVRYAIFTR